MNILNTPIKNPVFSTVTYLKFSVFLYFFYIGINTNLLNGHFQTLGFSGLQRAFIFFMIPSVGILSNFLWGYIADKKQNFKQLFILLCMMSCVSFTVCLAIDRYFAFVILGLCVGMFSLPLIPMLDSYVIEVCHEKKLHYGEFRQYGTIAFISANACIFILFMLFPGMKQHAHFLLFLIPVCFAGATLTLCKVFPENPLPHTLKVVESTTLKIFFSYFMRPYILIFFIIAFFHHTSIVGHYYYFSSHMKILHFSESYIALCWALSPIGEWFLFKYSSHIFPRFTVKQVLFVSIIAGLIRWQIQAQSTSPALILMAQVLHTFCFGAYYLSMIHFLMHTFPKEMRRTSQAMFAIMTSSLGQITGSWVYGYAFEAGHSRMVFHVASILSVLALLTLILSSKIIPPKT